MSDNGLLTVREIARRCHRSEETVRRWIWSGKLKAKKLGNQLFVDPAALASMHAEAPTPREVQAPYKPQRKAKMVNGMNETNERSLTVADRVDYDVERIEALMTRARSLREKISGRAGYIDVAEAVRESREEH